MPLTREEFVRRYRNASLTERASAQTHFIDLCDMLGQPHPVAADSAGERFTFEKRVHTTSGGTGFADVWMRDHFAWEYKAKHRDLKAAYRQLSDYHEDLGNPPLLVVCDFERFEIHTKWTSERTRVYRFDLKDLEANKATATCPIPPFEALEALFTGLDRLRPRYTDARVTQEAARTFSRLAERLEIEKRALTDTPIHTREEIAHFLMRLLFCLFADSIGLLPDKVFRRLIQSDDRFTPRIFLRKLKLLFEAMSEPEGIFGEHSIKYFNGGLFDSSSIIAMDHGDLGILHEASKNYDWSHVAPEIFGTLFERSLNAERRSLIGAHYTSAEDILLLIEPVVMQPLEARWQAVRDSILVVLADTAQAGESARPATLLRSSRRAEELLAAWFDELAAVRVLDPACGSGNFLYVALRRLLDLWNEARVFAIEHDIQIFNTYALEKMVSPEQLFGIEIEFYAHELASIVVWIGFLQWKREHGIVENREPILRKLSNIELGDAILRYDAEGKPYEPQWPQADFIVGNPPFLGDKMMRGELGDRFVTDVRALYFGRVPGGADLVTFWFEKARALVEAGRTKRVGLLATNSISMIGNRPVLARIKASGDIFMAWSDRAWTLNGAAVRVAMIAFDKGSETSRTLDGEHVTAIHADLTAGPNVTRARRLHENEGLCFLGVMKGGPFDLSAEQARKLLAWPVNPNGRFNEDVIVRRLGAQDITGRDRGGWLIDFRDMPEREAALYEAPFEYVKEHVKPLRDVNRDRFMKRDWWRHGRTRPALRAAVAHLPRYIATPEVSKHRLFAWVPMGVVPDHKLHLITRADDYFFAVLQCEIHTTWTLATCSWIGKGNDPSYNSASTFDTFPFPWPPGTEPSEADSPIVRAVADAARELVRLRDAWLNPPGAAEADLKQRTLTNLYNKRPAWLDHAHRVLDEAVFAAYGWPATLTREELLERLLALNHARAAAQPAPSGKAPKSPGIVEDSSAPAPGTSALPSSRRRKPSATRESS